MPIWKTELAELQARQDKGLLPSVEMDRYNTLKQLEQGGQFFNQTNCPACRKAFKLVPRVNIDYTRKYIMTVTCPHCSYFEDL